jgi:hypothetical protein
MSIYLFLIYIGNSIFNNNILKLATLLFINILMHLLHDSENHVFMATY